MSRRLENSKRLGFCYAAAFTVLLAVLIACMGATIKVKAEEENLKKEKIVSVVSVEEGDTIWSIAAEFYTEDYHDINELVDEIMHCNGISEEIRIGQNIFVPHYRQL